MAAMVGQSFASLHRERFPALAPELMVGSSDERFEFGLELILRGLEAMAEEDTGGARR